MSSAASRAEPLLLERVVVQKAQDRRLVRGRNPARGLTAHARDVLFPEEVVGDAAVEGATERVALRAALREDPDVVLIGEMRDLETIESALRIAETGHLTFGTLHTNTAASTINRIIDVFPAHQQPQIRAQLSLVLEGILCQSLLARMDGQGRAMCMEILVPNPAIRNLIREDKIHQVYSAMQSGQEKFGMQTFNQALATSYFQKHISLETALQRSSLPEELQEMINRGAGLLNRAAPQGAAKAAVAPAKR